MGVDQALSASSNPRQNRHPYFSEVNGLLLFALVKSQFCAYTHRNVLGTLSDSNR
jgi:hypothetical protein